MSENGRSRGAWNKVSASCLHASATVRLSALRAASALKVASWRWPMMRCVSSVLAQMTPPVVTPSSFGTGL
jgi:hypothetical protein